MAVLKFGSSCVPVPVRAAVVGAIPPTVWKQQWEDGSACAASLAGFSSASHAEGYRIWWMANFKPMATMSCCKKMSRRNFFCLIQKHLHVSHWSLFHFSFPSGIFLSLQQVWTCQTQSWALLELFWQHQQVVSVQPAKHIERALKCRGFVCFYSTLQWILKSSGNLAYFACLLGTGKLCCSVWKLLFIPPTGSVCLKSPDTGWGGEVCSST